MAAERCPECLLTPQAEALLEKLEDKLRRTRPGDTNWKTRVCARCGRLTAIADDAEGWSVGEVGQTGWSAGPRAVIPAPTPVPMASGAAIAVSMPAPISLSAPAPVPAIDSKTFDWGWSAKPARLWEAVGPVPTEATEPRPVPGDGGGVPGWVTVSEAAFLSNVSPQQVMEWIGKGLVRHHAIVRGVLEPGSVLVRTEDLDRALAGEPV